MHFGVRTTLVSLWLLLTSALCSAQIGLSLPFVNNITPNTIVNFPVRVTGFDSIAGVQFLLKWDPQVFQYIVIDNFNLPGLGPEDFGTLNAVDSGKVRLLWDASNLLKGETVADQTTIFRLRLKAIGAVGTGSAVQISEDLITPFDIARANSDSSLTSYDIDEVALTQGFGAVGYTVAAGEPAAENDFSLNISPNPFSEKAQVGFTLKQGADVRIAVADPTGRILLERVLPGLPAGRHGIEIASPLLREKGTCILILRAGAQSCARTFSVF